MEILLSCIKRVQFYVFFELGNADKLSLQNDNTQIKTFVVKFR